jgi:diguanylate cyclase (GGDEF)-like protein
MPGETILVADKNRRFLEKTEHILRKAGYKPVLARDGDEAIDLLRTSEPAVVLAGVSLPKRSGYQLARYVKMDWDATVACVLLYSADETVGREETVESGAENYLVRPLKRTELLACIRDMLTIRRLKKKIVSLRAKDAEHEAESREGPNAIIDAETGFYAMHHFKEILFREVKRAKRHSFPLSVALLAFDTGETTTGTDRPKDEVRNRLFQGLAVAIRQSIRDTDLPVRYADENVLLMMPHTELAGAVHVARRIQQRIGKSTLKIGEASLRPTISIGLASSTNLKELAFGELMKSATRALQGAVRAGGNRILFEQNLTEARG